MNLELLNPIHWKKSMLVLVLGSFVLIWFAFLDTHSLQTRWELAEKKKELIERTKQLEAESEALKVKIETLENDPVLLEKIAREEYGMKKLGETVYKIKKDK